MRSIWITCLLVAFSTVPAVGQDPADEDADATGGRIQLELNPGGHTNVLCRVMYTPDGKTLVTSAEDQTVRVWDAMTGEARDVIRVPGPMVGRSVALSRDGKTLAVAARHRNPPGFDFVVYLLSFPEGKIKRAFNLGSARTVAKPPAAPVLAFSPDGSRLAVGGKTIRFWNTADGTPGAAIDTEDGLGEIAFSPDGRQIVTATTAGCSIRNLTTGKTIPLAGKTHGGRLLAGAVAWSGDGKTVATCTRDGLQLWSPEGQLKRAGDPKVPAYSVSFSANSQRLIALVEGENWREVRLLDTVTGKEVGPGRKNAARARPGYVPVAVALSPDGRTLAQLAENDFGRAIRVSATDEVRHIWRVAPPNWLTTANEVLAGWSSDGGSVSWRAVADPAAWTGPATSFDLVNLEFGPTPVSAPRGAALKQGPLSLEPATDSTIQVLNRGTPASLLELLPKSKIVSSQGRLTLVGPDRAAVVEDVAHGFFLFDTNTGKLVRHRRNAGSVLSILSLAPSPDGRYLLALSTSQILSVFDAKDAALLLNLYVQGREWVIWTPNGGYYAASPGGERLIGWRVQNGADHPPSFYPAEQFRKHLYRPDVIKLVLKTGSVVEAVKAANAANAAGAGADRPVPAGEVAVEKLLPPGVTLAVADDTKLPRVTVSVTARQGCPEQPVKSLKLLVDGRPLAGGQAVVAFPAGQEKARYEATWVVDLPPGKHTLTVLARSKDDTPSVSNTVEPRPVPTAETDRPAVYHVAVGVNAYDQPKLALKAARGDAEQLAAGVTAAAKGGTAYQARSTALLVDKAATRAAVFQAIDDVRRAGPRPSDLFVLSFAGHGVRDGGEFFLLTREADPASPAALAKTAIAGAELAKKLADFPCQTVLLLDACHAGAVGTLRPGSDDAARALSDVDVRVAVMCAALGHESAIERNGAGLFTAAVVRALRHDPDAFYDRATGELNVYHLQAFVYQEVTKASDGKQTPYLKMPLAQPAFTLAKFPK
ncbi:caspase family protein [Limnoglobus roseus]|uniref:WD-40 repeat protein, beta transducin-like protein n=1 Tax=Limnoglobus roseus TaxID=2598579 RepID=A0A5C1AC17_9BACT|nr:caspase family protein [Limnoglobus roseus]QEL16260.1 WD-40 repeat protein, beta transducin-like protein [Limnoglobus roseus]